MEILKKDPIVIMSSWMINFFKFCEQIDVFHKQDFLFTIVYVCVDNDFLKLLKLLKKTLQNIFQIDTNFHILPQKKLHLGGKSYSTWLFSTKNCPSFMSIYISVHHNLEFWKYMAINKKSTILIQFYSYFQGTVVWGVTDD